MAADPVNEEMFNIMSGSDRDYTDRSYCHRKNRNCDHGLSDNTFEQRLE